jgi:hypothetical protein
MGTSAAWVRADGKRQLAIGLQFSYTKKMARVKNNFRATKKRGRPATGMSPVMPMRAPKELIVRVDDWAQKQPDKPSRSEAARRLIELALNLKDKPW